jgi:hypothetical protein
MFLYVCMFLLQLSNKWPGVISNVSNPVFVRSEIVIVCYSMLLRRIELLLNYITSIITIIIIIKINLLNYIIIN